MRELISNIKKNKQEVSIKARGYNVVILLGGNIGDVRENFKTAQSELSYLGIINMESSLYRTEAWGMEGADPFLNQVLILNTDLEAEQLLKNILSIERMMGRQRKDGDSYISRNIDIDILFIDSLIFESSKLEVPHPRLHLRKFTLAPLVELIPDFEHPILKKSILELSKELKDSLTVEQLDE